MRRPFDETLKRRGMASDAQQQRSDLILGLLISKGLQGCCPVCDQGRFSVGPEHVIISTADRETVEGAPVEDSAVVPVMCSNCGYTMLFRSRMLPNQAE
jgi:uncharacterized protein (DUF983 family)